MGQEKNAQKAAENEARAFAKQIKGSAQKLNLVAALIRGKPAGRALTDLRFCKRRVAGIVRKTLESAVANAENNHGLDVDALVVSQATVGRAMTLKRFRCRARGRGARVHKHFSNLTIVVQEKDT
ncbi:MAG TPA: 50S ribosomal protein L22 [Rhodospirillaceae bacterium]|jgi:large subunit ribosomal protein L22|nr:50S ribosomal protein L22 [Alphaproteobacteria bacterium]HBH27204.1 50S ribosomal protein L22 [Rhodospirillaceae bacterium]